jgi:hypothetical protein
MSDVAAYQVFVCALFPVQEGMDWLSPYLPALETMHTQTPDMLPHHS